MRWLVALVADTGMRLAEAPGLLLEDIMEDEDGIPFVRVSPHPWRRLKTGGSKRDIPLVGSALWAAPWLLGHIRALRDVADRHTFLMRSVDQAFRDESDAKHHELVDVRFAGDEVAAVSCLTRHIEDARDEFAPMADVWKGRFQH